MEGSSVGRFVWVIGRRLFVTPYDRNSPSAADSAGFHQDFPQVASSLKKDNFSEALMSALQTPASRTVSTLIPPHTSVRKIVHDGKIGRLPVPFRKLSQTYVVLIVYPG